MTFILLTGAGFSYNWGGPLASEIFNAVLADQSIDDHTRELLFASRGAFESVLADLQTSSDPEDQKRYGALITSVVGIFNGMNQTFMRTRLSSRTLRASSIRWRASSAGFTPSSHSIRMP
jgi:hypothetical protein